ncbi:hypothetical protein VNI00_001487 [Paramarasmius palmivorus]|uniref:Transmembrane protein n=1 Tax=Paramarasmius palmivorus TaxID=297713 RepID=A0AAW0E5F8_9AGAR
MSTSPRPRPPSSLPSTSSVRALSLRSNLRSPPPPISTVVTSPPWAKDEPPSPTEDKVENDQQRITPDSRPSDVASFQSTVHPHGEAPSRWWAFTLPRPKDPQSSQSLLENKDKERKTMPFRNSKSWLPSSTFRESSTFSRRVGEKANENAESSRTRRDWNLTIPMPLPAAAPFTVTHNPTPGWETPWTSRSAAQGPRRNHERENSYGLGEALEESPDSSEEDEHHTSWQRRKKRLRIFLLNNTYVPLFQLFRVINISFTSAALGVSIRIRHWESQNGLMGAVGSSPTLVVIFAPLTLVHVMVAIYLEYFGRPLGLWRTSAKLAHTLLEVLFIVAWSAALSLCFDNFFTSLIPCASNSTTAWYNQLPRPSSNLPTFEGSIGDKICDSQLSLICLVAVGLVMYCFNLVISLYRIFEKVKYLPVAPRLGPHPA